MLMKQLKSFLIYCKADGTETLRNAFSKRTTRNCFPTFSIEGGVGVPSPYLAVFSGRFSTLLNIFSKRSSLLVRQFLFFAFFLFLGPNAPPSNVRGQNLSSTSIFVQWSNVPAADQNGVILSYTVIYKALPNGGPQTEVVSAPTSHGTLAGLNEYTSYSITVFASTIKGDGNTSVPIIVITDEDSKF